MYLVIFVTCANEKEAKHIVRALLEAKLAACVNIIRGLESFFWWENKIDSAREILLIIKSKKAKLGKIIKLIKSRHSYAVPEIIALPIIAGDGAYLKWIEESTQPFPPEFKRQKGRAG